MQIELIFGQIPTNPLLYSLIGYVDSNFANNFKDQKLIMEYYYFFNRVVILWRNKKQRLVSTSIIKAEYIVLEHIAKKTI